MRWLTASVIASILAFFPTLSFGDPQDGSRKKVLLLPLVEIGPDAPAHAWLADAVRQSVLADLARIAAIDVITADEPRTVDAKAALEAGRKAEADFVIFGSYQIIGEQTRITGQVLSVKDGKPVGGLKASGLMRDLFALEDALATQIRRVLPGAAPMANAAPAVPEVEPSGQTQRSDFDGSSLQRSLRRPEYHRAVYDDYLYERPTYVPYYVRYAYSPFSYGYNYGYCGRPVGSRVRVIVINQNRQTTINSLQPRLTMQPPTISPVRSSRPMEGPMVMRAGSGSIAR